MLRFVRVFLCLALMVGGSAGALAADERVALVIGNGEYRNVPRLANPANDARAMADALRRLGFRVIEGTNLDRAGMVRSLRDFEGLSVGARLALFYYSGHAVDFDGRNYLLPVDARVQRSANLQDDGVPMDRVLRALSSGGDRAKVVLLDASHENPWQSLVARERGSRNVSRGLARIEDNQAGLLVAFSARSTTVASDGAGTNSVFTESLLRQITVPGVDLHMVMREVADDVRRATAGRQVPFVTSSLTDPVVLAPQPAKPPVASAQVPVAPPPVSPLPPPPPPAAAPAPAPESVRPPGTRRQIVVEAPAPANAAAEAARKKEDEERRLAQARLEEERRRAEAARASQEAAVRPSEPPPTAGFSGGKRKKKGKKRSPDRTPGDVATCHRGLGDCPPTLSEGPAAPAKPPVREPAGGASTSPVAPVAAPTEAVDRFPTIEAPDRVNAGATTTVLVSLTVDQVTPEVAVGQTGAGVTRRESGALSLPIPDSVARLPITVTLRAPGFDFDSSTPDEAVIQLGRAGDSTPARFRITARADKPGPQSLRVTFWHNGEFLASATRKIEIVPEKGPVASPPVSAGQQAPATLLAAGEQPRRTSADGAIAVAATRRPVDLTIEILYDDPRTLGDGTITIASPYFARPLRGKVSASPDLGLWLAAQYREFKTRSGRGVQQADAASEEARREETIGRLRAFGDELYRRAAPQLLRQALATLLADPAVKLRTVQVYSNNPIVPWELMRAPMPGGGSTDFFGIAFALARWHEDDDHALVVRPPQDQAVEEIVAVAPTYAGGRALTAPTGEIDTIATLMTLRRVAGRKSDFMSLMRDPPRGIIHFAGHGQVAGASAVERSFDIALEDGGFNVMDWRGLAMKPDRGRALFFFNACDIGQSESVAGAVEGWAPAILAKGASGYIGGLWPLKDDPAARFSIAFYRAVATRLAATGRASVADALADARKLVYETADPTYLGYAFYGDAQLALVKR